MRDPEMKKRFPFSFVPSSRLLFKSPQRERLKVNFSSFPPCGGAISLSAISIGRRVFFSRRKKENLSRSMYAHCGRAESPRPTSISISTRTPSLFLLHGCRCISHRASRDVSRRVNGQNSGRKAATVRRVGSFSAQSAPAAYLSEETVEQIELENGITAETEVRPGHVREHDSAFICAPLLVLLFKYLFLQWQS